LIAQSDILLDKISLLTDNFAGTSSRKSIIQEDFMNKERNQWKQRAMQVLQAANKLAALAGLFRWLPIFHGHHQAEHLSIHLTICIVVQLFNAGGGMPLDS
jgi:hypothetical protein